MSEDRHPLPGEVPSEEARRYAALVEQAEDGLYMLDAEGTFTVVNEALVELTGYERETLVGSRPDLVIEDDDLEEFNEAVRSTLRAGEASGSILTTVVTNSGQRKPVEVRFSLLPTDDGYNGLTGVVHDVRERRHREQKLDVLSRVLRHNVRNKLNIVFGYAGILQSAGDEQYRNAGAQIEQAAHELMELSEKARTAQTEVGFNPALERQTDLAELLEHLAVQHRREFPAARIITNLPEEVVVDTPKSYRIAVSELVENAIEHNPADRPVVRLRLVEREEVVVTTIEDECPPIPRTDRQAINEGKETPLVHSLGIGLWLANWVAETVGGELQLERREDDTGNRASIILHEF